MSNLPVIRKAFLADDVVQEIQDALPDVLGKHAKEIAIQFVKTGYAAVSQNPILQSCTPKSLIRSMQQSASLNLPIDKRQLAFFVPYKNKKGDMEAQLQISYLGLMELAYRSEKVKSITANCIYESEKNTVKIKRVDGRFFVEHPFSYEQPTGEMIAVYATAEVEGTLSQTVVLRKAEVEYYRSKSKAPNSPAWANFYEAMAKKTAIRQLAKFLPKSVTKDLARGAMIDEYEDFVTAQANATKRIQAEAGSQPIDTDFEAEAPAVSEEDAIATKAKVDAEKKALAAAEKKAKAKAAREANKKDKDALPKYHCPNCKPPRDFDEDVNVNDDGEMQCPKCLNWNVETPNEPIDPDITEENN